MGFDANILKLKKNNLKSSRDPEILYRLMYQPIVHDVTTTRFMFNECPQVGVADGDRRTEEVERHCAGTKEEYLRTPLHAQLMAVASLLKFA